MEYRYDDRTLDAGTFLALVQQVWPGEYDAEKTRAALARTINITAWDGGALRLPAHPHRRLLFWAPSRSCWCFPACRRQGVGRALMDLARAHAPTPLYFGAKPGAEGFYEKIGCERSLPSFLIPGAGAKDEE